VVPIARRMRGKSRGAFCQIPQTFENHDNTDLGPHMVR